MSRLDASAQGVFIISVTPFTQEGMIDEAGVERLVEFYLESGVDGITILGMMGEAQKLTESESAHFTGLVLDRVGGRKPVIVGVSAPGLKSMAALSRLAMDAGADGVMIAPPAGLRTDQEVARYFDQAVDSIGADTPFVLQDFPLANGVHFSSDLIVRIADAHPSCVMLKHEDWPGLAKITAVRKAETKPGRRRLAILVGNGGLFLPLELARGADGAMTGFAFPEMLVEVCRAFAEGHRQRGEDIFDAYLPLIRHEQQPGFGLAVRKHVLWRRGAIACPATRTPGAKLTGEDIAELEHLLARVRRALEKISEPMPALGVATEA